MPASRFLFSAAKHRLKPPSSVLQRFDPSKRIQACSYMKSSRQSYGKPGGSPVMNVETKTPRSWSTYAIPAVLLGFVGLATLIHYNDERRAVPKGQGQNCGCDKVQGPIIGGPFTLVDTENRPVTERNFLGNWVLLYFGYTSSPDIGPEQVQIMAKAIDTLESKQNIKILPVFVTIDPQRDTPAQLRAYLQGPDALTTCFVSYNVSDVLYFHIAMLTCSCHVFRLSIVEFDSRIVGLTGCIGALRKMAQDFRVYFKKVEEEGGDYLIESSHNMYLINPSMEVSRCFGVEYTAEELAEEIRKAQKRMST
ncbi:hypothetical protein EZV62_015267 [Acer yangbiense]|uniref:Thioredoxin domain-containing protein n=1 Tax=Acer yangbiense TaxID=1000413 RepID=A0A5C7HV75_9ROSI|nr:hypothetical protein EZV62_015267 [Acer yangbiense]